MSNGLAPPDLANPTYLDGPDDRLDLDNQGLGPVGTNVQCAACRTVHMVGRCALKLAGPEFCNLCGIAHFGQARVCPHIQSETQVRLMLEALKSSTEPPHVVREAKKYLRGLKGNLVAMKKQREAKAHASRGPLANEGPRRMVNIGPGIGEPGYLGGPGMTGTTGSYAGVSKMPPPQWDW